MAIALAVLSWSAFIITPGVLVADAKAAGDVFPDYASYYEAEPNLYGAGAYEHMTNLP